MRHAFSSVEMIVAALILGAALVPMYQMFVKGTTTATQSRLAYIAMQVAREELEEIRQIPFDKLQGHPFQHVNQQLFRWSKGSRCAPGNPVLDDPKLVYPKEYERISTALKIDPDPADTRLRKATLDVKWEETGTGSERGHEAISHYETLLGAQQVEHP